VAIVMLSLLYLRLTYTIHTDCFVYITYFCFPIEQNSSITHSEAIQLNFQMLFSQNFKCFSWAFWNSCFNLWSYSECN